MNATDKAQVNEGVAAVVTKWGRVDVLTSKARLPHLHAKGSGSIIFMGSVHSKKASALESAYVAAKHGLLGLARVITKEGGPKGARTAG